MAPLRGAAAHLWWSYYRVLKKREGVITDKVSPAKMSPPNLPSQSHPVLARTSGDEVDHRAHHGEIDEVRMSQEPEVRHVDEFLRRDAHQIGIGGGDETGQR